MRKKSGLALYVSKTLKKERKHPVFQKYTPLMTGKRNAKYVVFFSG